LVTRVRQVAVTPESIGVVMRPVEEQPVSGVPPHRADPNEHAEAAEEFLDAVVHRRLANVVVRAAYATPVTAMHLTVLAALFGVVAGYCFADATQRALVLGAVFLFTSHMLDCADGQLARARGQSSMIGRIADGLSDYAVGIAVHVGMLIFLSKHQYTVLNVELSQVAKTSLVAFAGASMTAHCLLFDLYKNRYLAAGQSVPNLAPEPAAEVLGEQGGGGGSYRPLLEIYAFYNRVQQSLARERVEQLPEISAAGIRLWGAIGPANHHGLLVLTVLCAAFTKTAPFYYIFLVGVVMNIYMAALLVAARVRGVV
jgi:phosphatidylglycerophosphate synthase